MTGGNRPSEQHFLRSLGEMSELLDRCGMRGRNVLEIGVGDGAVTRLLSARGARFLEHHVLIRGFGP